MTTILPSVASFLYL